MKTSSLIYDGSFNGLLTCVFASFDQKLKVTSIQPPGGSQNEMFAEVTKIHTNPAQAKRVWNAFKKIATTTGQRNIYYAYLTETKDMEIDILKYLEHTFYLKTSIDGDYTNMHVLKIAKAAKQLGREKHRMEAFVRFKLTKDDIYFATINPDFNVLPVIKSHFTTRYSDQQWIIYDTKRKFGLYYNLNKTEVISLDFSAEWSSTSKNEGFFDASEIEFQHLWKEYFQSTTIKSRINKKLHHQHVPKRYWQYLIEKNPLHI